MNLVEDVETVASNEVEEEGRSGRKKERKEGRKEGREEETKRRKKLCENRYSPNPNENLGGTTAVGIPPTLMEK